VLIVSPDSVEWRVYVATGALVATAVTGATGRAAARELESANCAVVGGETWTALGGVVGRATR